MEQPSQPVEGDSRTDQMPVWADHDQLPMDGHWLYVVDANAWDHGDDRGVWVPSNTGAHTVLGGLNRVLGRHLALDNLAVIDQLGDQTMVDEDRLAVGQLR